MSTIKATTAKTSADGTAHSPGNAIGGDRLTKRIVRAKPYTKAETIRSIRITTPLENLFNKTSIEEFVVTLSVVARAVVALVAAGVLLAASA